jgi:hypothetical protein
MGQLEMINRPPNKVRERSRDLKTPYSKQKPLWRPTIQRRVPAISTHKKPRHGLLVKLMKEESFPLQSSSPVFTQSNFKSSPHEKRKPSYKLEHKQHGENSIKGPRTPPSMLMFSLSSLTSFFHPRNQLHRFQNDQTISYLPPRGLAQS